MARRGDINEFWAPITAGTGTDAARIVRIDVTKTRQSGIESEVASTFNSYGLPTEVWNKGRLDVTGDGRCVKTNYATPASGDHWRDRASKTIVAAGDCSAPYDRVTTHGYDGNGNLTSSKRLTDATLTDTSTVGLQTTYTVDTYGRPTSSQTPGGKLTTTAYTPSSSALTTSTEVTGPGTTAYHSATVLDPFRSVPVTVTDRNGRNTITTYDGLGRVKTIRTPQDGNGAVTFKADYDVTQSAPPTIKTSRRLDGSTYVDSWELFDGFGRIREKQTLSPNSGGGRIVTSTSYDAYGQASVVTDPYYNSGVAGSGLANSPVTSVPTDTKTTYDAFGRPTLIERRGRIPSPLEIQATSNTYEPFETTTVSPEGRKTTSTVDPYGNTTKIENFASASTPYRETNYEFNSTDQLTKVTDTASDVTTYTYDPVGRRIAAADPNAGSTTFTYDSDDQLVTTTDATGAVIKNHYDAMGRITGRTDETGTPTLVMLQSYWEASDTPSTNRGLPKTTATATPQGTHISNVDAYDSMSRPTSTTETLPSGLGSGIAGSYTTTTTYDAAGNQRTVSVPAVADLAAETITRSYTTLGVLDGIEGVMGATTTDYLAGSTYGNDGRILMRTLGSSPNQIERTYTYNKFNQLLRMAVGHVGGSTIVDDYHGYDDDGNVKLIRDAVAGNQRQCFNYDHQNRLTEAWTTDSGGCEPNSSTATIGSGPDPYEQHFTYDTRDRITSITSGTTTATTNTYTYAETGNAGPHAVTSIANGSINQTFTYNQRGDTLTHATGTVSTNNTYDHQGRLTTTTTPSATTTNTYTDSGDRIARQTTTAGSTTTVAYIAGHEITRPPTGSVTAKRYYDNAMRDSSGLTWLISDSQGSTQVAIDATTPTNVDRQRYLPYGAPRGAANQLPTDRNYVGETKDPETPYIKLGARYYNPATATFLSTDPLVAPGEAKTLNAYIYSGNNPTTFRDPTGLSWFSDIIDSLVQKAAWARFRAVVAQMSAENRERMRLQRMRERWAREERAREREANGSEDRFVDILASVVDEVPNLIGACMDTGLFTGVNGGAVSHCSTVKGGSLYGISTVERKDGGLGQLGLEVGAGGFASNAENPHDLSGLSDCMTLAGGSMSGTFCASKNEWNEYSGLWTLAVSFSAPMPGTITKQLDTINDFIPRGGQIAVAEAETVVTEFNVVDFIAEHFGDAILDAKESYDRAQRCGIFNLNWRC